MREGLKAILSVVALVAIILIAPVLAMSGDESRAQAKATDIIPITITPPKVTLPPVVVTDVITINPDPITVTQTVRIPGPTETVTVPGPTTTLNNPEATATVTERPEPRPTATVTETATVTPSPTGQSPQDDGTVTPDDTSQAIDFGDGDTTTEEVVVIGVSLLVALGCILLALWLGYTIGYKDNERKQKNFMIALRQQIRGRK